MKENYPLNLTRNFKKEELECPCCNECEMDPVLLTRLQSLRDIMDTPLVITSGYRCENHNEAVGGSERSQHLFGKAVDIKIKDLDSATRHKLIKTSFDIGFSGVGIGKTKFHVDVRDGEGKSWGYS